MSELDIREKGVELKGSENSTLSILEVMEIVNDIAKTVKRSIK